MKIRRKAVDEGVHRRYDLSNGGHAIVDRFNKMVAYNKSGRPDGQNWDWVRKDYQAKG